MREKSIARTEADTHGHVADGVLKNEVPAYDPRDQLTHRCVSVGIGTAGDRDHRCQFGVAQPCERANNRHQHERERQGRTGTGASCSGCVMNQIVEQRCVEDRGSVELLSGNSGADDREDSGSDHRANTQCGQRPWSQRLLEPILRVLGIRDQFVDGFLGETRFRRIRILGCQPSDARSLSPDDCEPRTDD